MRRLVFILLLVFLPLQSVWGAAASYCRHETGGAAKHFGHHEHKHRQGQSDGRMDDKGGANVNVADTDCTTCHLTASPTLAVRLVVDLAAPAAPPQFSYHRSDLSHIPAGPERPDRALA